MKVGARRNSRHEITVASKLDHQEVLRIICDSKSTAEEKATSICSLGNQQTQEIKALNKEVLIAQRKLDQVISGKNSVFAKDVMLKRRPQASEIKALNKEVLIAQRKLEQVISDKNAGDQSTEQG
ncbi:hypothetical protein CYMTET_16054, partial [Cymbomonas tetramitiformis]